MKTADVLEYAFTDFTSNKFKTMMSSLGIIIGVLAIVAMLTLGDGLYNGISGQFGNLELDTMVVLPISINAMSGQGSGPPAGQAHGPRREPHPGHGRGERGLPRRSASARWPTTRARTGP